MVLVDCLTVFLISIGSGLLSEGACGSDQLAALPPFDRRETRGYLQAARSRMSTGPMLQFDTTEDRKIALRGPSCCHIHGDANSRLPRRWVPAVAPLAACGATGAGKPCHPTPTNCSLCGSATSGGSHAHAPPPHTLACDARVRRTGLSWMLIYRTEQYQRHKDIIERVNAQRESRRAPCSVLRRRRI